MPRNLDKTRCIIPGCRAWAMRGHERCRPHRDRELGSRGAGAPPANLNALQHGAFAHPLAPSDLGRLAVAAIQQPGDLAHHLGLAVRAIQARVSDPFLTLVALRSLLSELTSLVAATLFSAELNAALQPFPPLMHDRIRALIEQIVSHKKPEEQLLFLRKIQKRRKQLPEQGSERTDR